MSTHVVLDLSRLMWRAERFAPTGIDRVELAYARHLIATIPEHLSFTGWWGRMCLLPKADAVAMIKALDATWSGNSIDADSHAQVRKLTRKLRRHALLRGERGLHAHIAAIGTPIAYLLVSHYRLHRPAALERIKRRGNVKFVFLIHDIIPIEHPKHVPRGHDKRHRRRMDTVSRLANHIIVNSAGTEKALRRHFAPLDIPVPIRAVPLGIDMRMVREEISQNTKPYFVYLSTIESRKNHRLLLKVWRNFAETLGIAAPKLVFIGRHGWKSKQLLEEIRRSPVLHGLIDIHDRLTDRAVARLLTGARALLFPSFAEGFGLPVAEALALGVPVLCSDLAELREVGGAVPEFLDPYDMLAWRDMILDYAQPDSARRQTQLERLTGWRATSWDEHFHDLKSVLLSLGVEPP